LGFDIKLDGKRIINLGHTLLHEKECQQINKPYVLMIPIGGRAIHNTMDAPEAVRAVKIMQPNVVIPCHYNCPEFFTRTYNPSDDVEFKVEVEETGARCEILQMGDSVDLNNDE
jgi:L-ascorbate metabolism protein UlaG (beta-lactamase superfamily)